MRHTHCCRMVFLLPHGVSSSDAASSPNSEQDKTEGKATAQLSHGAASNVGSRAIIEVLDQWHGHDDETFALLPHGVSSDGGSSSSAEKWRGHNDDGHALLPHGVSSDGGSSSSSARWRGHHDEAHALLPHGVSSSGPSSARSISGDPMMTAPGKAASSSSFGSAFGDRANPNSASSSSSSQVNESDVPQEKQSFMPPHVSGGLPDSNSQSASSLSQPSGSGFQSWQEQSRSAHLARPVGPASEGEAADQLLDEGDESDFHDRIISLQERGDKTADRVVKTNLGAGVEQTRSEGDEGSENIDSDAAAEKTRAEMELMVKPKTPSMHLAVGPLGQVEPQYYGGFVTLRFRGSPLLALYTRMFEYFWGSFSRLLEPSSKEPAVEQHENIEHRKSHATVLHENEPVVDLRKSMTRNSYTEDARLEDEDALRPAAPLRGSSVVMHGSRSSAVADMKLSSEELSRAEVQHPVRGRSMSVMGERVPSNSGSLPGRASLTSFSGRLGGNQPNPKNRVEGEGEADAPEICVISYDDDDDELSGNDSRSKRDREEMTSVGCGERKPLLAHEGGGDPGSPGKTETAGKQPRWKRYLRAFGGGLETFFTYVVIFIAVGVLYIAVGWYIYGLYAQLVFYNDCPCRAATNQAALWARIYCTLAAFYVFFGRFVISWRLRHLERSEKVHKARLILQEQRLKGKGRDRTVSLDESSVDEAAHHGGNQASTLAPLRRESSSISRSSDRSVVSGHQRTSASVVLHYSDPPDGHEAHHAARTRRSEPAAFVTSEGILHRGSLQLNDRPHQAAEHTARHRAPLPARPSGPIAPLFESRRPSAAHVAANQEDRAVVPQSSSDDGSVVTLSHPYPPDSKNAKLAAAIEMVPEEVIDGDHLRAEFRRRTGGENEFWARDMWLFLVYYDFSMRGTYKIESLWNASVFLVGVFCLVMYMHTTETEGHEYLASLRFVDRYFPNFTPSTDTPVLPVGQTLLNWWLWVHGLFFVGLVFVALTLPLWYAILYHVRGTYKIVEVPTKEAPERMPQLTDLLAEMEAEKIMEGKQLFDSQPCSDRWG
ncbi:unnamed protein product [Amoebophrya sp. A25]|nr:unnamed protein product [Amoebophrya sp. A25]|eukprot:GSA25T00021670001.1